MHLSDMVSLHEIAKRTGLSRNTVRSCLRKPERYRSRCTSARRGSKMLSGYVAELENALKTDAYRPKPNRRTGRALFTQLKAQRLRRGYICVTDFIRA